MWYRTYCAIDERIMTLLLGGMPKHVLANMGCIFRLYGDGEKTAFITVEVSMA